MGATHEKIGLLFVHGMGEQKRWDHLRGSVLQLAELLRRADGPGSVTVVDRTADWKLPPGARHPEGLSPITLTYSSHQRTITYQCHEVFWADLGARSGIFDAATFWLWGLGQWCAPIYRELDAAQLPKAERGMNKPISRLVKLPRSVAGHPFREPLARFQLLLAALTALFVACTWSLAKRLFAALLGQAPSPTLIVQYVGDVRTYESRAAPGDAALSDPGHPRRVGIRRRMVAEMVAMGADEELDGWYVVAHSLGTILAYNGLTEIGHALPNYLPEAQWSALPDALKEDAGCCRREDVNQMMPARPPWLDRGAVINRPLLFERLRGFLTYGSPLDKFAGLWPRIVATATDREFRDNPFPRACRWINLAAPTDPVSGWLDEFAPGRFEGALPQVENVTTPWSPWYGMAHILYFRGAERHRRGPAVDQKQAVARWLIDSRREVADRPLGLLARFWGVKLPYLAIVALAGAATALLVALLVRAGGELFGIDLPKQLAGAPLATAFGWAVRIVLPLALLIPLTMGLLRWVREGWLNAALARADQAAQTDPELDAYWRRVVLMLRRQAVWASLVAVLALLLTGYGVAVDLSAWLPPPPIAGYTTLAAAALTLLLAIVVQTLLNRTVPGARPAGPGDAPAA